MASTTDPFVFIEAFLPDSKYSSNGSKRQERSVDQFFDIITKLPEGATVAQLEYWGRNKGPKKLHHFLCATIQLPGGELELYIYGWETVQ